MNSFLLNRVNIKKWLDKHDIKNYKINKNLTVDVDNDVYISKKISKSSQ